jgi:membrane protein
MPPPEPPIERPAPAAVPPPEQESAAPARMAGLRRRLAAARARYEGSWLEAFVRQLKALDIGTWATVFGAELLWSALPFVILVGSLASTRVDDDLSRHIGLDRQGARIVAGMFRTTPTHAVLAIATGLLFSFAGVLAVVASLETLYEKAFDLDHRGWRDLPRQLVWIAVLFGLLIADGAENRSEHSAVGPVVETVVAFVVVGVFFAWTMHFLLAGRVAWRRVIRPALATAVLWIVLSIVSSFYFSGVVVDDSRTFGTIGVVFTFLTWFFLIGAVIVLGAAIGAVWERYAGPAPDGHPVGE